MNLDELRKSNRIVFEVIAGSHAYGTSTPKSDLDIRGTYIMEVERYLGLDFFAPKEQIGDEKSDIVFYDIKRFISLVCSCNPNMIELLWTPEDCIIHKDPVFDLILKNRKLFISQEARNRFIGYAKGQIEKARGQNKWANNPKSKEPPTKQDFCWYIPLFSQAMQDAWDCVVDLESGEFPVRPISVNEIGLDLSQHVVAKLEHAENVYRLYDIDDARGVFRGEGENLTVESITKEQEFLDIKGLLIYNEQAYNAARKDWNNYWDWHKNRNKTRYEVIEGKELDYDCYLDSETEFLTNRGWLKFDHIVSSDMLGTINPCDNSFEWQNFYDKFDSKYNGSIYTYENSYSRFSVTPNHKLYISDCHRSERNNYSLKYERETANWHLETVEEYLSGRKSFKHIMVACEEVEKVDVGGVSDDYIKMLGLYLSEGSIFYDKKGVPQYVSISQLEGGKSCKFMDELTKYDVSVSKHFRKGRNEFTYIVKDADLAMEFSKYGTCSEAKRPPFDLIMSFSSRQADIFINSLFSGDGHYHSKGHSVYYTCSRELSDLLYAFLIKNGKVCQLYGPYEYDGDRMPMYQIFISDARDCFAHTMHRGKHRTGNSTSGWIDRYVKDERIVCFSVENSILITRNNNKIAMHGNSKNMHHCVRILMSGRNILKNGEPIVRVEGDDLKLLMGLRNGDFKYEEVAKMADDLFDEVEEIKSDLPEECDMSAINEIYKEIIAQFNEGK